MFFSDMLWTVTNRPIISKKGTSHIGWELTCRHDTTLAHAAAVIYSRVECGARWASTSNFGEALLAGGRHGNAVALSVVDDQRDEQETAPPTAHSGRGGGRKEPIRPSRTVMAHRRG